MFLTVPLVSRLCPSDVYKVYKRGSNVRIDTTLLGFDHTTWQRGNRTYIFKGDGKSEKKIQSNLQYALIKCLFCLFHFFSFYK